MNITNLSMSRKTIGIISKILNSAKSVDCGFKLGCAAVKNGKLIAISSNSNKTHTIAKDTRMQGIHAEMGIVAMLEDLSSYDIYVARWRPSGPGLAAPCTHCMKVLKKAGCKEVFYTINQTWEEAFFNPILNKIYI